MTKRSTATQDRFVDLRASLQNFDVLLRQAIAISESRIGVNHTGRQNRILSVFAKVILHSMAMPTLVQPVIAKESGLLDHLTAGMLTRSIIDAGLMTMYLSEPGLTRQQWQLRRAILGLHEMTNRKRFLEAANKMEKAKGKKPASYPFFETYEQNKADKRGDIRLFAESLNYSEEQIEKFQEGQLVFIEGSRGAVREAGWDINAYEYQQAYYSAYVHSHPISFLRWDEQEINFENPSVFQLNFVVIALETAAIYLSSVTDRVKAFTGNFNLDPLGQVD